MLERALDVPALRGHHGQRLEHVAIRRLAFGDELWNGSSNGVEQRARALRWLGAASLVCWAGATTAGRLLAYTYTRLTSSW